LTRTIASNTSAAKPTTTHPRVVVPSVLKPRTANGTPCHRPRFSRLVPNHVDWTFVHRMPTTSSRSLPACSTGQRRQRVESPEGPSMSPAPPFDRTVRGGRLLGTSKPHHKPRRRRLRSSESFYAAMRALTTCVTPPPVDHMVRGTSERHQSGWAESLRARPCSVRSVAPKFSTTVIEPGP
jgi:hypothetical protein